MLMVGSKIEQLFKILLFDYINYNKNKFYILFTPKLLCKVVLIVKNRK